jgi:hypothetical protein
MKEGLRRISIEAPKVESGLSLPPFFQEALS